MRRFLVLSVLATGGGGCGSESYLVITVEAPPAIHDVAKLEVTRYGEEPPQVQMLPVLNFKFPVTFSISGLGNAGTADLAIHAISKDDLVVGTSRTQVPLSSSATTIHLDTTDFVVNSEFLDDQFLTEEADSVGRQIASTALGDWTVAFGATCVSCDIYGRRFNSAGVPSFSGDAEGPFAFRVSSKPSRRGAASPAIATSGLRAIVVWDFADIIDGASGVACRSIDERGIENAGQQTLSFESAKGVDVAALPDGNFVVTWLAQLAKEVHMAIVQPDCTLKTGITTRISTLDLKIPRGAHVASNGNAVLYAWILGDSVRFRGGTSGGELFTEFPIDPPPDSVVEQVRVGAMGPGFAIALRLAARDRSKPGSIVLYRATAMGELVPGTPTVITDQSGSNTTTGRIGFGIATRGDGATMIVWHQCPDGNTAACLNQLDVYGRLLQSDGTPASEPFVVPTTTDGNQRNPSVTALEDAFVVTWTDESMAVPDTSGMAVRARIIYPTL